MNYTLDDTSSQLVYTGWAAQSPLDSDAAMFFGGSYHVAQRQGAMLNMTIDSVGGSLYIYGSMGPEHGDFSVQVDDKIAYLSAGASEVRFQQPLFSFTFDANASSTHFVSLTAILASGPWLDVDFVTIGQPTNSTSNGPPVLPNTVHPPWQTSTTSSTRSTSSSSSSADSVAGNVGTGPSHAKANVAAKVLAILFGSLIAIAVFISLIWLFLRRRYDRHRAREHRFRVGTSRPGRADKSDGTAETKPVISAPIYFQHTASHTHGGGVYSVLGGSAPASSAALSLPPMPVSQELSAAMHSVLTGPADAPRAAPHHLSPPPSPGFGTLASSSSLTLTTASEGSKASDASAGALLKKDGVGAYTDGHDFAGGAPGYQGGAGGGQGEQPGVGHAPGHEAQPRAAKPMAFLSSAPTAFGNMFKRMSKGDADSMKTDFLQV
ncbi:hypothetical protein PsYK624_059240 [Phanerochaete sordida]|uniref:Uncharacterized protein n=1 Tax=Phanerochaete sordida TaxID=48140 RepID=A0A9P3LBT6_9APHY|nr:hypothetical protein PsYK624_059240 [Phanerochaete sordida]